MWVRYFVFGFTLGFVDHLSVFGVYPRLRAAFLLHGHGGVMKDILALWTIIGIVAYLVWVTKGWILLAVLGLCFI